MNFFLSGGPLVPRVLSDVSPSGRVGTLGTETAVLRESCHARLAFTDHLLPRQLLHVVFGTVEPHVLPFLPHFRVLLPLIPGGIKRTHVAVATAQFLHRSRRNRRRTPLLASCMSRAGPGQGSYLRSSRGGGQLFRRFLGRREFL
jgi:hypothetical protein